MRRRKDYSLSAAPQRAPVLPMPPSGNLAVLLGDRRYDFSRWLQHGTTLRDAGRGQLVAAMCAAVNRMCRFASPVSIRSIVRGSIPVWFEYLDALQDAGADPIESLTDVTRRILEDFASWLLHRTVARTASGRHSYTGARTVFTQVKSVWLECVASGAMPHATLPDNPFPNSNRAIKSPKPYSLDEMRRLLAVLGGDLQRIRVGLFDGAQSDRLIVYLLLVAARTGRDPSPIFEMRRDAVRPHPLRPETHALLTTYKRRGDNVSVQSVKAAAKEIEDAVSVSSGIATLIGEVLELTEHLVARAPKDIQDRLWLFESARVWSRGDIISINPENVHDVIGRFVERHLLLSDDVDPEDGRQQPFQLTIMRLRKTFASKMWQLTGGDLARTALALGNQPSVTDTHYLAVSPEMVKNHRFVGICLEANLRGKQDDPATVARLASEMRIDTNEARRVLSGKYNTGVGRCSSPMFGRYAPKTGDKACTAFLSCFRCPNQVIMETDLTRLFSFYWLIVKERTLLQRNQWHKVYGWVIREIDQVIAPKFSREVIAQARALARIDPHPMWRSRAVLAFGSAPQGLAEGAKNG